MSHLRIKLGLMKNFVKPMAKCNSNGFNLTIFVTRFLISGKLNWKKEFCRLQICRGFDGSKLQVKNVQLRIHWIYKLRRHSGGHARSLYDILRFIVFKQKLQNCFSLHGDGLAYISEDAFFSFTPMFFGKSWCHEGLPVWIIFKVWMQETRDSEMNQWWYRLLDVASWWASQAF